jgi:hypothetical protein
MERLAHIVGGPLLIPDDSNIWEWCELPYQDEPVRCSGVALGMDGYDYEYEGTALAFLQAIKLGERR